MGSVSSSVTRFSTPRPRGRVYLELADATPAETERGMALLKKLVG